LSIVPSAFAAETRPYTGVSFGPDGATGSESFANLQGVAVDQASGNVYAYDSSAGKIYKFDAAGAPVNFSATGTNAISEVGGAGGGEEELAVAPAGAPGGTAGDIYAATNSIVKVYAPSGAKLGEFGEGETCGVATDPAGHVFVGSYSSTIREYVPSANPVTDADKAPTTGTAEVGLCNVAADGLGHIYAANYNGGQLAKLTGIGDPSPVITQPGGSSLAIDPSSNDLLLDRGDVVSQIDSSGNPIANFGSGRLSNSHGVAISSGADEVYVGNGNKVDVFGSPIVVPDSTAEAATGVTGRKATLHGIVNSAGQSVTSCEFEYGNGEGPDLTVPCEGSVPNDGNDHQVSAALTGLTPDAHYTFRLIAANANGANASNEVAFMTIAGALTEPATDITATGAKLNGIVAPEGEAVTECFFEYGPVEFGNPDDYSLTAPCVGETPADEEAHQVSAVIGLQRGVRYHFRLFIKQPGGELRGAALEFAPAGATPREERISQVGIDQATFEAEINPQGSATSYFFEYGPSTSYGTATPEVAIGSGEEFIPVSQTITGLTPGTTYHWRVVIVDSFGEGGGPDLTFATQLVPGAPDAGCPNQAFREFAGATLPDCRGYEQASPIDKGGLNIEGFQPLLAVSPDGSRVSFFSQGGSGIPASGGAHQEFTSLLSSRQAGSWSTQRLLVPEEIGERAAFIGASEDLRYAFVEAGHRTGSVHNGLYVIDTTDSSLATVIPYEGNGNDSEEGIAEEYSYEGSSTDGSRVFFEAQKKLTDNAAGEEHFNLYMWDRASGHVSLVSVLPGEPAEAPNGGARIRGTGYHAISQNGNRAYFTATETGQIYLRRGLAGPSPDTVHVSAPEEGVVDPDGPQPAELQEVTPDGSLAYFLSSEKLTADATTGASDGGRDLYRYDADTGTLVDVAPDLVDPNGAKMQGLLGVSADGSSGYFAAEGVLAPGGTLGQYNIYRFVEEESGNFTFTFVARLSHDDPNEGEDTTNWTRPRAQLTEGNASKTSRVSPDGQSLVFSSRRSITGYDNHGCGRSGFFHEACQELYLYSAGSESLYCISCNPTGEVPKGAPSLSTPTLNAHLFPANMPETRQTRNLAPDGSRVFFQTPDPLVAGDTNGDTKCESRAINYSGVRDCQDVYEWEAPGAPGGSCQVAEVNGGCLYLLSTGKSKDASFFTDASADGTSAFIGTTSQLVPTDRDELYDLYDVRTDGGSASQHVLPPTLCSSGEACHGASSTAPSGSSPGTSSFQGPGNPKSGKTKAKKCKKNAHNNCGKKKHKKKKQRKKSAKRPNATTRKAGGSK
jgi:hypothetical protein